MKSFKDYEAMLNEFKKTLPESSSMEPLPADDLSDVQNPELAAQEAAAAAQAKRPLEYRLEDEVAKIQPLSSYFKSHDMPSGPVEGAPKMPLPVNLETPNVLTQNSSNIKDLAPTAPPIPAQLASMEPGKLPVGAPTMPPASLMNNKPVEENIEQQTMASNGVPAPVVENSKANLLNRYRSLASSDKTTGLKTAQEAQNKNQFNDNLLRGVNLMNSGLTAGGIVKPADLNDANKSIDALDKTAKEPVNQYEQTLADQKNDPSSNYSNIMRSFFANKLKAAGIDVDADEYKNMSGSDIAAIGKFAQQDSALKAREEYNKHLQDIKQQHAQTKQEVHMSEQDTKRFDTMGKLINGGLASSRSGFGKDVGNLSAIQNAKALLEGGNLDDIDNRQITETARVLDRILSQGSPTISGTEHLTPDTARMRIAKMMEFATSKRHGSGAADFLKNTIHTLDREQEVAKSRTQDTIKKALAPYQDLIKRDPEKWDSIMAQNGLMGVMDSQTLSSMKEQQKVQKEEAKSTPPASVEAMQQGPKPRTVSQEELKVYAGSHSMTPEAAKAFLTSKGYTFGN